MKKWQRMLFAWRIAKHTQWSDFPDMEAYIENAGGLDLKDAIKSRKRTLGQLKNENDSIFHEIQEVERENSRYEELLQDAKSKLGGLIAKGEDDIRVMSQNSDYLDSWIKSNIRDVRVCDAKRVLDKAKGYAALKLRADGIDIPIKLVVPDENDNVVLCTAAEHTGERYTETVKAAINSIKEKYLSSEEK